VEWRVEARAVSFDGGVCSFYRAGEGASSGG
jgi:hypothetical protein